MAEKHPSQMNKTELQTHAWTLGIDLDKTKTRTVMWDDYQAGLAELEAEPPSAPAAVDAVVEAAVSKCPPHQPPDCADEGVRFVCVKCGLAVG